MNRIAFGLLGSLAFGGTMYLIDLPDIQRQHANAIRFGALYEQQKLLIGQQQASEQKLAGMLTELEKQHKSMMDAREENSRMALANNSMLTALCLKLKIPVNTHDPKTGKLVPYRPSTTQAATQPATQPNTATRPAQLPATEPTSRP